MSCDYEIETVFMKQERSPGSDMFKCIWSTDHAKTQLQSTRRLIGPSDVPCCENLVEYVITAPGTFPYDHKDRAFETILLESLLPGTSLHGNLPLFTREERLRQRVHISTHPDVNSGKSLLVKFAVWAWKIGDVGAATAAYKWLQNIEVVPSFLGHVTEGKDGRVIGFVSEFMESTGPAELKDIAGCEKALKKLHELGIKMGDINKFNFLISNMKTAKQACPQDELKEEMKGLKVSLENNSFLDVKYIVEE
ncbi:hypothetical protein FGADI_74 [Fusarium gaditjirri]|uniref:Uncharacterized protein n=1 Tax=Fusarium gaditjirri TaxID=282569 RepID=A0A8H4X5H2_9HYPO|nr:hypothetical protein FGADI_74 [Fusarium gaditjirri]